MTPVPDSRLTWRRSRIVADTDEEDEYKEVQEGNGRSLHSTGSLQPRCNEADDDDGNDDEIEYLSGPPLRFDSKVRSENGFLDDFYILFSSNSLVSR